MIDSRPPVGKSEVLAVVTRELTPYVGATMAAASVRAHCEKLGLSAETLSPEQVEALLLRLSQGLAVFVGREKAASILGTIRQSLAGGTA